MLTLAVIGLLYGIYFFSYVPKKEKRFVQEKFRVLNRIAKNIQYDYMDRRLAEASKNGAPKSGKISLLRKTASRQIQNYYDPITFDAFIILHDTSILYQSLQNQVQVEDDSLDKLVDHFSGLRATNMSQLKISEVSYHTFATHFTIDDSTQQISCYLIGLLNQENFRRKTREINRWVLIQAFIILLILLMSMPWIKLISMNTMERLYRSNVAWLAITSAFGLGMVMMIYISGYTYLKSENHVDHIMAELSDTVRARFCQELHENYSLLERLDTEKWVFTNDHGDSVRMAPHNQKKPYGGKVIFSHHY